MWVVQKSAEAEVSDMPGARVTGGYEPPSVGTELRSSNNCMEYS